MTYDSLIKSSQPSAASCILEIGCPNSYYAYPNLLEVEAIPANARGSLDYLWNRSVHAGRKIRILELFNVFVTKEGLVFSSDINIVPESQTYHSQDEINDGINKIRRSLASGDLPTFERCILAKSRGATNYGHFVLEMLPRAWIARRHLHVDDWPVLIHRAAPDLVRVASQAMNALGVRDENILTSDEEPVFVKHIIIVDGLTNHTEYLSPFVMECLDEISASIQTIPSKKIYTTRGPNSSRDFLDEPVIARKLADSGYNAIFTGALDFQSQIMTFKSAERVVGVMGAALTNIAFCKPGTPIFCFMPSTALEVLFWMIAQARRLNYYEIRCAEVGPQLGALPWDRSIQIDPDRLARIVSA